MAIVFKENAICNYNGRMKVHTLATSASITVWWEKPDKAIKEYAYYLDGEEKGRTEKTHFTISGLENKREYEIGISGEGFAEKAIVSTAPARRRIDITKAPYNAIGDGKTLNTEAIQRAFDDAAEGEEIYIPEGVFLTGALRMHSNTALYLEKDATLQGTADPSDYEPRIPSRFEGIEMECLSSVINIGHMDHSKAPDTENILIYGEGTIASGGKGLAERVIAEETERIRPYLESLGDKIKECEKPETIPGRVRPRLINISNARNVRISGITLKDGASWNVHILYSEDVVTDHCTFRSEKVWNGDGWDPDSSERCTLFASKFYTGDDSVAIKSGKNPEGNVIARPTKEIRVFDCYSESGHGIMIGSEISGGVEDVYIWDNDIARSSNGFEIKGTKKRGGYVRNIRIRDSASPCVAIHSVPYNDDGIAAPDVPLFSDMSFENLTLTGISHDILTGGVSKIHAIEVEGFEKEGHEVRNISFKGINLRKNASMHVSRAVDLTIEDISTF